MSAAEKPASGLAMNLATIREQFGFAEAVEACASVGITWVAPWRDQVARTGLSEAAAILRQNGVRVTGYCRGGMFPAADAAGRAAAIEDNKRALAEAVALDARCLVLVVGTLVPGSRDLPATRQMVADGIGALLPHARAAGMPLAIEPLHPVYAGDRACINTISQALDLCDALGDGVGVILDTYHTWWDPDLPRQIARAGTRILGHHISDFLVPTRDPLNDRGMMGDGVVDFKAYRRLVEAAGYAGPQEVEIFSTAWWSRPGREVLDTCLARYRAVC